MKIDKTADDIMWGLNEALEVIRSIQPACHRHRYHAVLGGGVLNVGYSRKDLDLFFLPFGDTDTPPDTNALICELDVLGAQFPLGGGFGFDGALTYPNQERTFKTRFTYRTLDDKRIDVFIAEHIATTEEVPF